ncbi:hypothetical protein H8788_11990 [Parabacteroides faecis]|uniref:hypothetical protein n=1 Tax=Parabacteroides TaxID=375288 RepID=UPI000EFF653A|nr:MULTISPECIES: hypothetical protein [Parabacteroides]MBC8618464.1 hypothetical protein [Parabacteroides faecis]RHR94821.1 hypothetical protein DWW23_18780 [Parabacteroides sp. AF14-59]
MKTLLMKSARLLLSGVCLLIINLFIISPVRAQIPDRVFKSDHRIDPEKKGQLLVEVDNISFFKDNEYSGSIMKGYSLPGFWLQPKAVFYPLSNIKLELGVHMLRYWGAKKYPALAYQDIARWKGDQFQHGFHVLPFFRAQIALSDHVNVVLGDIYGGANHNLIEPLYNPELNLTADPEAGLQLLYDSRRFDLDVWVNWESFIFRDDTHQEAFTVGVSGRYKLNDPDARFHFYAPVQGLAQHRGGEIDTILTNSVQTLMNGSVGVGTVWNTGNRVFRSVNLEFDVTGYYQQAGKLWPYGSGSGFYARASADISDFRVKASYWNSNKFISMFGSPFYGAVSTSKEGVSFDGQNMVYLGLEYSRSFGKGFSLGVDVDVYQHLSVNKFGPAAGEVGKSGSATSFSAGVYLRINPSFLIKRF